MLRKTGFFTLIASLAEVAEATSLSRYIGGTCRTTFYRRRPTIRQAMRLFETSLPLEFNHDCVGITTPTASLSGGPSWPFGLEPEGAGVDIGSIPGHWRMMRICKVVGSGKDVYEAVRDAVLGWEAMHENSKWAGIHLLNYESGGAANISRPGTLPNVLQIGLGPGAKRLVTYAKTAIPGLWAANPCMVVYDLVDMRQRGGITFSSTAYATLRGHLLRGEERASVCLRDLDGSVAVEVLSLSRPAPGIMGRMVFPFVAGMQRRFFQEQIDSLERIAGQSL